MVRHNAHVPQDVTEFGQQIQVLIAGFEVAPSERTYQLLYEAIRGESVEKLASLGVELLTKLKEASASYLCGANIGVLCIQDDPRWPDDRKHAVEAEQKELQSRICSARRQCAESELRKKPYASIPATSEYSNAVRQKIGKKASEVVVKAPYAYPADRKGLVHDVIVEVYKGQKHGQKNGQKNGEVINFPLSKPNDKAALEGAINMAKSAAFEYYNSHRRGFERHLNPMDYGVWVYIDDYPDGTQSGNGFSGTSFTLAVAIGIWACLRKIRIDKIDKIAASGEINSHQGRLNEIGNIDFKAKAARLGGIEKLFASIDIAKELDALQSILEARRIQFNLHNQRPANTEVIHVHSLEEVLRQIPIPLPPWRRRLIKVWKKILEKLLWVLIGMAVFMLLVGGAWFYFDRPTPISHSFYVSPREIKGYEGENRDLTVHVNFRSRIGTTLWLKLASVPYGRFYWIECPKNVSKPELVIRNANFNEKIQCTVPSSTESIRFELKNRDDSVFAIDVPITVLSKIPEGGEQ